MDHQLDPDTVPRFPVFHLTFNDEEKTAELDRVPVEAAYGEGIKEAAIQAIITKAQRQNLNAVRVRATTNQGDSWHMIVSTRGDVIDTTPAQEDEISKPGRTRKWLLIGAVSLTGLALVGATTAVIVSVLGPGQATGWTTPGTDQQIPVALPTDFADRSGWTVPIAPRTTLGHLDTGHIINAGRDGTILARDPSTAEILWRGTNSPEELAPVVNTTWNGADVLAWSSSSTLRIWDLRTPEDRSAVPATDIRLDQGTTVQLNGEEPVVNLGDWIVGIPGELGQLDHVTIPAGTLPLHATRERTVITIGESTIATVDATGAVVDETPWANPHDTRPIRAWMLDDSHALLGWNTETPTIGLIDLDTTEILATTEINRLPDQSVIPTLDSNGGAATLESLAVVWDTGEPSLHPFEHFTVETINQGLAYGTSREDGAATLDLHTPDAVPEPWDTFTDEDAPPALVTNTAAFVIAPQLDETLLYQSPTEDD